MKTGKVQQIVILQKIIQTKIKEILNIEVQRLRTISRLGLINQKMNQIRLPRYTCLTPSAACRGVMDSYGT